MQDYAVDTLCWVRRIKEAYLHRAALVFNLSEEEGLVVGVPLQIYLRNSNDFSRSLLYGFNFSLYINK